MPRDIISINTTHYVGNNMYRLKLPKAVQFKKGDKLSLYSFSMYNSFYNISASQYGNSNITFTWFNGTTVLGASIHGIHCTGSRWCPPLISVWSRLVSSGNPQFLSTHTTCWSQRWKS